MEGAFAFRWKIQGGGEGGDLTARPHHASHWGPYCVQTTCHSFSMLPFALPVESKSQVSAAVRMEGGDRTAMVMLCLYPPGKPSIPSSGTSGPLMLSRTGPG